MQIKISVEAVGRAAQFGTRTVQTKQFEHVIASLCAFACYLQRLNRTWQTQMTLPSVACEVNQGITTMFTDHTSGSALIIHTQCRKQPVPFVWPQSSCPFHHKSLSWMKWAEACWNRISHDSHIGGGNVQQNRWCGTKRTALIHGAGRLTRLRWQPHSRFTIHMALCRCTFYDTLSRTWNTIFPCSELYPGCSS